MNNLLPSKEEAEKLSAFERLQVHTGCGQGPVALIPLFTASSNQGKRDRGCYNQLQWLDGQQWPWSNLLWKLAGCCGQRYGLTFRCKRDFLAFEWKKAVKICTCKGELGTLDSECLPMFPKSRFGLPSSLQTPWTQFCVPIPELSNTLLGSDFGALGHL